MSTAVGNNIYMDGFGTDFPSFMKLPSAKTILSIIKRTFWDHLVPQEARNFIYSMFIGRLKIVRTRLPTLAEHKRELLLVAFCGTVGYVGHRVIAAHGAAAKARNNNTNNNSSLYGGVIAELDAVIAEANAVTTTTTTNQCDEKKNELLALIVDGKFGRTQLMQKYMYQQLQLLNVADNMAEAVAESAVASVNANSVNLMAKSVNVNDSVEHNNNNSDDTT